MGQAIANSSDAALFTDWAPGPYGEWSGDCKKLVSTAYRRAGLTLVSGNAKPTFDYYWANRSLRGTGLPRYGALVGFTSRLPTATSRLPSAEIASRRRVSTTDRA